MTARSYSVTTWHQVLGKIKHKIYLLLDLEADKKGEGECEDDHNPGDALEEDSRHTKTAVTDLPSTSSSSDTCIALE